MILYFKQALRQLVSRPLKPLISIIGLTLAPSAFLLITSYTQFELTYDSTPSKADRIYRVGTVNIVNGNMVYKDAMSFNLTGPTLKQDLPEVEEFTRAFALPTGLNFRHNEDLFREKGCLIVDPAFVTLFDYTLIHGDRMSCLIKPYSIVLTGQMALKYFGTVDAVGKTIEITGGQFQGLYNVTGIVQSAPANTHLRFDCLISYSTFWQAGEELNWSSFNDYTYILLRPDANPELLQEKLMPLSRKYIGEKNNLHFYLQSLRKIHLFSDYAYEPEPPGSAQVVYMLIVVAVLILIIAWVNYVNITIAEHTSKAKQVGIRKAIGASIRDLRVQFIAQFLTLNILCMLCSLLIMFVLFAPFKQLIGEQLPDWWSTSYFWTYYIIIFISGIVVAGAYPAITLSNISPASVFKKQFATQGLKNILNKSLVTFQFATSAFFISATLVVYQQIQYMLNRPIGMDLNQVVVLKAPSFPSPGSFRIDSTSMTQFRVFKSQIQGFPWVTAVTTSSSIPGGGPSNIGSLSGGLWWEENISDEPLTYYVASVDEGYLDVYGIKSIAGDRFDLQLPLDSIVPIYVNRKALELLGFPDSESAINEYLVIGRDHIRRFRVLGVIENINRQSLKSEIEPTFYWYSRNGNGQYYSIKMNAANVGESISQLESKWKELFPGTPFEYFFADDQFNAQYQTDKQLGKVFLLFSIITVFIACMGLYGLTTHFMNKKTKEIAIRKVVGASTSSIAIMLSKTYLMMLGVSLAICVPAILLVMNNWLKDYAYHISIKWWMIALTLIILLIIVFASIGYKVLKAASANPAATLKSE